MKSVKNVKIIALIVVIVILASILGFYIYVNDYYRADDLAISIANSISEDDTIDVIDNLTILKGASDIGIVFYPGAKVEAISYLPILQKLQNQGFTCVLVEMPFNMAIFDVNACDMVFDSVPYVNKWYISGHSMGGGMASSYASKNQELFEGLILMGAYVYGDYPTDKSVTIYGTYNSNLEKNIDYEDNIVIIEGGNHAKFGNYGVQEGDPIGDITTEEQQDIAVEAIVEFISRSF